MSAITLIWICIGLIVFSYAVYPVAMAFMAVFFRKPHRKEDITPGVTIIIPAHNEEKVIADKLENVLSLDYPPDKMEILLVMDGCTDRTKAIAEGLFDTRLKAIEQVPRKGKMAALNLAVSKALGDIVVFTDANSLYGKDAVRKLVRNFADAKIGCVCGELRYNSESLVGEGEDLYWKYEKFIKEKESQMLSLLVVNGSIYAVRKYLFEPVEETLADDFVVPMMIARKGYGLVYEPEAVTYEKTASDAKEGINQKARIIAQGLKASFAIGPAILMSGPLRVFQFLFHKFIRWVVPLMLIIIISANMLVLDTLFYRALLLCQILFYFSAVMGYFFEKKRIRVRIFKVPLYFCIVNVASAIGLFRFITDGIEATWEKAETTRG
jgi:cellulose synthase/poly-beta-1,6-N-acetylglucosamine synthase-like glycosyltransferase